MSNNRIQTPGITVRDGLEDKLPHSVLSIQQEEMHYRLREAHLPSAEH